MRLFLWFISLHSSTLCFSREWWKVVNDARHSQCWMSTVSTVHTIETEQSKANIHSLIHSRNGNEWTIEVALSSHSVCKKAKKNVCRWPPPHRLLWTDLMKCSRVFQPNRLKSFMALGRTKPSTFILFSALCCISWHFYCHSFAEIETKRYKNDH